MLPPRPRLNLPPDAGQAALEYEIAQEKASALGRLGRRLESSLAELAAFDAAHTENSQLSPEERERRRSLVAEAGVSLWYLIVQREALGLRNTVGVLQDYRVPREVGDRVGLAPVPLPRRRRPRT
jgi:hypothetical protein